MTPHIVSSPRHLSNAELIDRVRDLAGRERRVTAALVAHLAELEERQLHLAEGCQSLFAYCTEVLHLSEHAAYGRIEAARAGRKFPLVLEKLADGSIHLTTVSLLAGHLTEENHRALLAEAAHKSRRQVEEIVVRLRPRPDVKSSVRRIGSAGPKPVPPGAPDTAPGLDFGTPVDVVNADPGQPAGKMNAEVPAGTSPSVTPGSRRAKVEPLSPDRYHVHFTADAETHALLEQARELLRHQVPDGDAGAVIRLALKLLVKKLRQQKFGERKKTTPAPTVSAIRDIRGPCGSRTMARTPASRSRHIAANVRRAVWHRDAGRCAFVSTNGRRCTERGRLEFHHVRPFAAGGPSTTGNIELRCRAHNRHEAELFFDLRRHRELAHNDLELGSGRVERVMSDSSQ